MSTKVRASFMTLFGLIVFGAMLFVPAGTLAYWQAWVFLAAMLLSTGLPSLYVFRKHPEALDRRMQVGQEDRPAQRVALVLLLTSFAAVMVIGGIDHRFALSSMPLAVVLLGDILVVVGMALSILVVAQNEYAAANVTVEGEQRVISTGLYGIVRHPMYTVSLLATLGMPLALGSWWALCFVVLAVIALVIRIRDEERMLRQELVGYPDYMNEVRSRLIPLVW
ncbi:isoprenylcysteine carboxylmethyltransferase family protein [Saccharopolyspora sp. NPDC049357]|uniref:methyltransferase family protein n=1 Tax=Saccharopolyspora sp. NPDC049357 TaxID=3154507 RepID=UPI003424F012